MPLCLIYVARNSSRGREWLGAGFRRNKVYQKGSSQWVKVKVKVNVDLYSASSWTPKAHRYGTRSQGISQFYLHIPRSSANGINMPLVGGLEKSQSYIVEADINNG